LHFILSTLTSHVVHIMVILPGLRSFIDLIPSASQRLLCESRCSLLLHIHCSSRCPRCSSFLHDRRIIRAYNVVLSEKPRPFAVRWPAPVCMVDEGVSVWRSRLDGRGECCVGWVDETVHQIGRQSRLQDLSHAHDTKDIHVVATQGRKLTTDVSVRITRDMAISCRADCNRGGRLILLSKATCSIATYKRGSISPICAMAFSASSSPSQPSSRPSVYPNDHRGAADITPLLLPVPS
jgi:hypothetical protein